MTRPWGPARTVEGRWNPKADASYAGLADFPDAIRMKIHNLHPWDVSPKEAVRLQGAVLRTRDGIKPIFVSPGHKIDVDTALSLTLACTTRYRIPEPTGLAHLLVTRMRRRLARLGVSSTGSMESSRARW